MPECKRAAVEPSIACTAPPHEHTRTCKFAAHIWRQGRCTPPRITAPPPRLHRSRASREPPGARAGSVPRLRLASGLGRGSTTPARVHACMQSTPVHATCGGVGEALPAGAMRRVGSKAWVHVARVHGEARARRVASTERASVCTRVLLIISLRPLSDASSASRCARIFCSCADNASLSCCNRRTCVHHMCMHICHVLCMCTNTVYLAVLCCSCRTSRKYGLRCAYTLAPLPGSSDVKSAKSARTCKGTRACIYT